jgi:hypothetical protein
VLALASVVSPKMPVNAEARLKFPGEVVVPAAVAPLQTIACQNDVTPWAMIEAAADAACERKAEPNAPRRMPRFAVAFVARPEVDVIAGAAYER